MPFSGQELEACQGTPEFAAEFRRNDSQRREWRVKPATKAAEAAEAAATATEAAERVAAVAAAERSQTVVGKELARAGHDNRSCSVRTETERVNFL
jgi:hypothetical protein